MFQYDGWLVNTEIDEVVLRNFLDEHENDFKDLIRGYKEKIFEHKNN